MEQVFAITQSRDMAESIDRYFRFTRGSQVYSYQAPATGTGATDRVTPGFRRIAAWMESCNGQGEGDRFLRDSIAIVELGDRAADLKALNPISAVKGDWGAVVAMLILAFPEVHWVLIAPNGPADRTLFAEAHLLWMQNTLGQVLRLYDEGLMPLFDPTGLRNDIRHLMNDTRDQGRPLVPNIRLRDYVAAAIDEEKPYACFNAYVAYRFGFRSHIVTSFAMMDRILKGQADDDSPSLVFEDMYLGFPDKKERLSLSDLTARDMRFPGLGSLSYRIFVTAGHEHVSDSMRLASNKAHLDELKKEMWIETLPKPLSGIFDLWRKSGMWDRLGDGKDRTSGTSSLLDLSDSDEGGHSAPGRLLVVADHLIGRASPMLNAVNSVPAAVTGAVLTLEAQELLNNRTPTATLAALALKHQFEVLAECMFYGVEYNMDVDSRFKDISEDVTSVKDWFEPETREKSALNAQIRIMSQLALRFRELNQFDEEQQCLSKIRHLRRKLWRKNHRWSWPLVNPFRWYIDSLLGSIKGFMVAIVGWLAVFSLCYFAVQHEKAMQAESAGEVEHVWVLFHAVADAVNTFFGLQLAHDLKVLPTLAVLLNVFVILIGFVHLGIFVSHLYTLMARR